MIKEIGSRHEVEGGGKEKLRAYVGGRISRERCSTALFLTILEN